MITVTTNLTQAMLAITEKISTALNSAEVTRYLAVSMAPVIRDRIHVQGKAADGSQIGTYSKGYMAVRTGQFKSNGVYKSGKRKGEPRDTGTFSRGARKGQPRPSYNRTNDTTVVVSLTRQMENDWGPQAVQDENAFGIGYNNPQNVQKAAYVEATYKKKIFSPTAEEQEMCVELVHAFIEERLK